MSDGSIYNKTLNFSFNSDTVSSLANRLTESHKINKLNEEDSRAFRGGSLIKKRKKSATVVCCYACMYVAKLNIHSSQQNTINDVFGFNVVLELLTLCNRVYLAQVMAFIDISFYSIF